MYSLERWKGQVCIVTGASSGIGEEIALQLASNGLNVVAIARRIEKLEQLAKLIDSKIGTIHPFKADVTKEDDILKLFNWVKLNHGPVHILVNAAGITRLATLTTGETSLWEEVLETNVLGLCIATREAVKDMRENSIDGHVIHINSIGGHIVIDFPKNNVYPASKHCVTALTETIRQELNSVGSRIKVTSISPALVRSEMYQASALASGRNSMSDALKNWINATPTLETGDIADAVIYSLSTPPHVQVHEIIIRAVGSPY